MKRLMMLSGAFALGGVYAVWLKRQRHLQAEEESLNLQTWEAEGGNPSEVAEPNPPDALIASRRGSDR